MKGNTMMKRAAFAALLVTAYAGTGNLLVSAEGEMLSKEEIIENLWADYEENWNGPKDDGTVFPEASYRYYFITDWVNTHYGESESVKDAYWGFKYHYNWTDMDSIRDSYEEYYDVWSYEWSDHEYEEGVWTLENDKTGDVYHFELVDNMWNELDSNNNVVLTFSPHPIDGYEPETEEETAEDEETSESEAHHYDMEEGVPAQNGKVTPDMVEWAADQAMPASSIPETRSADQLLPSEASEQKGSSGNILVYVGVGVAAAAAGVAGAYFLSRKKR